MQAWEDFLVAMERDLGKDVVNKWLRPLRMVRFDACNLYLEARDTFQMLWFEEHIRAKTLIKLTNGNNKKIKVHLSVASQGQNKNSSPINDKKASRGHKHTIPQKEEMPLFAFSRDDLDPSCTFNTFISSSQNLLSYRLLTQLVGHSRDSSADIDMSTFNPVYLYGNSGAGKTHLLMAAAHTLKTAGLNVLYTKAETFTENVVRAIRAGEMQTFRKLYRSINVLIVDDIQIFSGKSSTQEEFFHTFNTLHLEGKLILLSANCPPSDLKTIEPRLVSRFEWGITIGMENSDNDTAKKILIAKASSMNYPLSNSVLEFLLDTFSSSMKALMQALESLILRTHLEQTSGSLPPILPLDIATAKHFLGELIQKEKHASITPERILHAVAEYYGIKVDDIMSKSQSRDVTFPRQIAMHLCRQQLKMPYMKIGSLFSRDHSTVMSSVRQILKNLDEKDPETIAVTQDALRKLKP